MKTPKEFCCDGVHESLALENSFKDHSTFAKSVLRRKEYTLAWPILF